MVPHPALCLCRSPRCAAFSEHTAGKSRVFTWRFARGGQRRPLRGCGRRLAVLANRCLPGNMEPQQPRVAPGESPALRPAKRGARSAPRGAPVGFFRLFRALRRPEKACCSPPRQPAASPRSSLPGASLRACARAPQPGKSLVARGASPADARRGAPLWGVALACCFGLAPAGGGRPCAVLARAAAQSAAACGGAPLPLPLIRPRRGRVLLVVPWCARAAGRRLTAARGVGLRGARRARAPAGSGRSAPRSCWLSQTVAARVPALSASVRGAAAWPPWPLARPSREKKAMRDRPRAASWCLPTPPVPAPRRGGGWPAASAAAGTLARPFRPHFCRSRGVFPNFVSVYCAKSAQNARTDGKKSFFRRSGLILRLSTHSSACCGVCGARAVGLAASRRPVRRLAASCSGALRASLLRGSASRLRGCRRGGRQQPTNEQRPLRSIAESCLSRFPAPSRSPERPLRTSQRPANPSSNRACRAFQRPAAPSPRHDITRPTQQNVQLFCCVRARHKYIAVPATANNLPNIRDEPSPQQNARFVGVGR